MWGKATLGFGPDRSQSLVSMATNSSHRVIMEKTVLPLFMPPTLKKLMGHIAFGACVRGWVTLFVPSVTFKPLKLEY